MKNTHILFLLLCLWASPLSKLFSQSECNSSTYIKRIGSTSSVERGLSMSYSALEDVIYIAGSKDDSVSIIRLNTDDEIEWVRTFDIVPGKGDHVHKVIVDSEGMIVITGTAGTYNALGEVFAFRYDPFTNTVMWAKRYLSYTNCYNHGLEELTPGDHFTMSNNPSVSGNNDAQVLRLNRLTGDVIPELSFHYDVGDSEALNDIILHDGYMYANGRYTDGPDFRDMRNTTTKIDPVTGESIWTILGHIQGSAPARLYGAGMVIDQDEIFSLSVGDENGTSVTQTDIWVQKTNLDGEVLWINKYDLPGANDWVDEIISSDGGFVILARTRVKPAGLVLFKINRDGTLLWSYSFDFSIKNTSLVLGGIQGNLQQIGNYIYFTAFSEHDEDADIVLVKTDLQGKVGDSCALVLPVDIIVTPVNNPVFYTVEPELFDHNPEIVTDNSQPVSGPTPPITSLCSLPGTIQAEITKSICLGTQFEGYSKTGIYIDTFEVGAGCDSVRTLYLNVSACADLVLYNLNDCTSFMHDGTNMDYTEFTPEYLAQVSCADISANTVFRTPPQENKHSCTPGLNGTEAMCISAMDGCTYNPGDQASLVIEVTIDPSADSVFNWTGLEFYEKAPLQYNWISGPSGLNNYPTLFGIRILKNGTEIFRESDISTSLTWSHKSFDFIDNPDFTVTAFTVFRIELLPYCPVGNGEPVAAWDLEDIVLSGGCLTPAEKKPVVSGQAKTAFSNTFSGPQIMLSTNPDFTGALVTDVSTSGYFSFDNLEEGNSYYLRGYNNSNPVNGLNTADLILIQKHLLGIKPLVDPAHFIAADADKNGKINVLDLLILKKLLLGIIDQFPSNTSWRFGFVNKGIDFTDVSMFNEQFEIEVLGKDTTQLDVLAIKTGDLTGDALSGLTGGVVKPRTQDIFYLETENHFVTAGVPAIITIKCSQAQSIEGIQMAMQGLEVTILGAEGNTIPLSADHFHLRDNGTIRLSWHTGEPLQVQSDDILFTLRVIPHFTGWLDDHVRLVNEELAAELYCPDKSTPETIELRQEQREKGSVDLKTARIEPNPFSTMTNIHFTLDQEDRISIRFFNASGKVVYQSDEVYASGPHTLEITRNDLGGTRGVFFGQIYGKGFSSVHKLVILD